MFIKLIIIAILAALACGPKFHWDLGVMSVMAILFSVVTCATADGLAAILKRLE